MANVDRPFGLRPLRHMNHAPYNGATTPMYIASTYETALFVGDPVVKVAGGSNAAAVTVPGVGEMPIGALANIEKVTAGNGNYVTGVIVGFAANPDDLTKQYRPADTERVAFVCNDPDVVYEIQADGAIPAASIGLNAVFIFTHAGDTATGYSGVELDTTSDVPAADASNQLLIVGANTRADNDTTLTHAKVEVKINLHSDTPTGDGDGALGI